MQTQKTPHFTSYFYPRSPCGERLVVGDVMGKALAISIHALLAESDMQTQKTPHFTSYFYPRSPCGERHPLKASKKSSFLISIHALLAESDSKNAAMGKPTLISIHALLAESDVACIGGIVDNVGFLSTLSLRRATTAKVQSVTTSFISIHALLAESDFC